jgi:serine/threonine protein kinase
MGIRSHDRLLWALSWAVSQLHTAGEAAEAALWHHVQGVLAYELIVGRPPFEKETRAATYECIMYRKPPYPSWLSDSARSFIDTALHKARSSLPV